MGLVRPAQCVKLSKPPHMQHSIFFKSITLLPHKSTTPGLRSDGYQIETVTLCPILIEYQSEFVMPAAWGSYSFCFKSMNSNSE